jgi:outer membrane lipoprotein-sorting protein
MKVTLLLLLFMFACQLVIADDLTGQDIVQKVSDLMNQKTAYGVMKLTIITTSGKERTFTYESFSANKGEKNAIIYSDPIRVKGQATLLLNNADDIWSYDPRTDRVRKLASHAKKLKMQGSDFTYEDFGSGDAFLTDFKATRMPDEKAEGYDCYKVELKDNGKGTTRYHKLIMWVIKENFVPIVIDYYDKDDPEIVSKRLVQSDIKLIESVPTAFKAVMYNKLDDSRTTMEIVKIKYNVDIDQSRFNQRSFYR